MKPCPPSLSLDSLEKEEHFHLRQLVPQGWGIPAPLSRGWFERGVVGIYQGAQDEALSS